MPKIRQVQSTIKEFNYISYSVLCEAFPWDRFTFTHVYGPSTTQEDLFRSSSLNLVTDFVSGQNCLLFTYGATNSGKTFTVQGTPEDAGLLPRTVQHIFNLVGENHYPRNDLKPKFCCKVTRLEEQDVIKEEEKRESIFKIPSNLTTTFSQSTLVCTIVFALVSKPFTVFTGIAFKYEAFLTVDAAVALKNHLIYFLTSSSSLFHLAKINNETLLSLE
ncbi:Kinesin-like protein KIF20A [Portunus trituberculatus]|uniref:Kinesin-like protein KIF20A n=1 Tax=Portunus trituberculatus TaxID=210409 RepID=A0A5B7CI91_PORTR|nr:Kinesin-like protein KIF20A [Portunus trituberculatus]